MKIQCVPFSASLTHTHTHSTMRFCFPIISVSSSFSLALLYFLCSLHPLRSRPSSHQHFSLISSAPNFICSPPVSMPTHPLAPQTPGGGNNWLKPDTPIVAPNQIRRLILHIIQSNRYGEGQGEVGIGGAMKRGNGSSDTHIPHK